MAEMRKIILVLPPDIANDLPPAIKETLAAYTHGVTIMAGKAALDSALNGLIELERAEEKADMLLFMMRRARACHTACWMR